MFEFMWEEKDHELVRRFKFANFIEAFGFMTQVAIIAEKQNHHPTFINTYGDVTIRLSTHDAGDIVTAKDRALATAIDAILTPKS